MRKRILFSIIRFCLNQLDICSLMVVIGMADCRIHRKMEAK
jgi:hypothetical protein